MSEEEEGKDLLANGITLYCGYMYQIWFCACTKPCSQALAPSVQ